MNETDDRKPNYLWLMNTKTLYEGKHLRLMCADGWEYVEHREAREAVMIVAITPEERLVLVEEFRPAVGASVICVPAGLVGDTGPEEAREAAVRELEEETGFEAPELDGSSAVPARPGRPRSC